MNLSVIVPVYNEQGNIAMLQRQLNDALNALDIEWEIIYVNDGSTDNSGTELRNIAEGNSGVTVITLARNFGQTQALAAGVEYARGEVIVTIDADGQNDPVDIPKLLHKLAEGYDVVSGWRVNRQDNLFWKKIPSYAANRLSRLLTGVRVHDLGCTLKAYKKDVLKAIEFHGEIHRLLPVYAAMQGAKITEVPVVHHRRHSGKSKYGLSRVFNVCLDMLMMMFVWKFISKPMYMFGGVGLASFGISVLLAVFIVLRKLLFQGEWISPLMFLFVIFCIMGIQFVLMGILAELVIQRSDGKRAHNRYIIKTVDRGNVQ
ncbi:MAG: glycosyltransferase family 2 protein [Candidatus Omnitrophica bacterium]|nr:glycosyltransferase family 2 protein [Candidatus Omnitrophota bacterium]